VLVVPFFFDAHDFKRRGTVRALNDSAIQAIRTGLTLRQALRTPAIIRIAIALLIATTLGVAITVNKVPLLTAGGMSRHDAALITASAGVFGIGGKLLTGWLLDRWKTSWVPGISLALPTVAYLALLDPRRTLLETIVAIMIFAYSSGAYLQVCTYLTSRYGGLLHFGKIFGLMASLMSLGSSAGTQLASSIFDRFGNYTPLLVVAIPLVIIAGLLVSGLGAYPQWDSSPTTADPHLRKPALQN
jgi:predicted MFS family arabinose efflux permease